MLGDIYCLLKGTPITGRPLLAPAGAAWQFRSMEELKKLNPAACVAAAAAAIAPHVIPVPAAREYPWIWVLVVAALAVAMLAFLAVRWRRRRSAASGAR